MAQRGDIHMDMDKGAYITKETAFAVHSRHKQISLFHDLELYVYLHFLLFYLFGQSINHIYKSSHDFLKFSNF